MGVTKLETNNAKSSRYVIELIDELKEMAEAGELLSIGVCGVMGKGKICEYIAGGADAAALLGASMLMQDRIKRRFDDE